MHVVGGPLKFWAPHLGCPYQLYRDHPLRSARACGLLPMGWGNSVARLHVWTEDEHCVCTLSGAGVRCGLCFG